MTILHLHRGIARTTVAATLVALVGLGAPVSAHGIRVADTPLDVPEDRVAAVAEYLWTYAIETGRIVQLGDQWVPFTLDAHDWGRLAQCEAGGRWSTDTGNGFYGALQILESTWVSNGGLEYAAYPHLATAEEQIQVGRNIVDRSGWGAWPACSRLLGLRR